MSVPFMENILARLKRLCVNHMLSLVKDRLSSVSMLALGSIVLVSFAASLNTGFYTDDYVYLKFAGEMSAPDYFWYVLDPRSPFMTYRPLIRILFGVEHLIFGFNPLPYHFVHLFLHLSNVLLLFVVIRQLGTGSRVAFVASALYAAMPVYS